MAYVIKWYSNRKLYYTQESRYVTLGVGPGHGSDVDRDVHADGDERNEARWRDGRGGGQAARGGVGLARPPPLARGAASEAQGRGEVAVPPLRRRRPLSSSSRHSRTSPGCPCPFARPSRTAARPTWSPPARCPRAAGTPSARCPRPR